MRSYFYLDPEELERDWEKIEPILGSVVSRAVHGEFDCSDLKAMAQSKRIVIGAFFDDDGVILLAFAFEFRFYPKKTAVNILALEESGWTRFFQNFWTSSGTGRQQPERTFWKRPAAGACRECWRNTVMSIHIGN